MNPLLIIVRGPRRGVGSWFSSELNDVANEVNPPPSGHESSSGGGPAPAPAPAPAPEPAPASTGLFGNIDQKKLLLGAAVLGGAGILAWAMFAKPPRRRARR